MIHLEDFWKIELLSKIFKLFLTSHKCVCNAQLFIELMFSTKLSTIFLWLIEYLIKSIYFLSFPSPPLSLPFSPLSLPLLSICLSVNVLEIGSYCVLASL